MKNSILKKFSCFHYNIGFFPFSENILRTQPDVHWLKHPYKDRFFADPFILNTDNQKIEVLVEEFLYSEWKGRISLLTIDRNTLKLISNKVLLDLTTHLSFPFVFRENGNIYVAPENSQSGRFSIYFYENQELKFLKTLLNQPLVDSIIYKKDDKFLVLGSIQNGRENGELYMWSSDSLLGDYEPIEGTLIKRGFDSSRRSGDLFEIDGELYSSSQYCCKSYGEYLNINKVIDIAVNCFKEEKVNSIYSQSPYDLGLHTLNIYCDIAVVDGLTELLSPFTKTRAMIRKKINIPKFCSL